MEHKLSEMVNVKSKTCIYSGCKKHPTFNREGLKIAIYCYEHKLVDMVNVKMKICIYEGCKTRASYGDLFKPKTHCAKHKSNNQFTKNNPVCEINGCELMPVYTNDKSNYPIRCEDHKLNDDQNIVEQLCKSCNILYFINNELGLCNDCFDYNVKKVQHAKEIRVKNVLDANKIEYLSHDKIPEFACNKKRPDFIFDLISFFVILEVDENQHSNYACECEQGRMIMLHQDFGGAPVIFIRYNPDKYIDWQGKKHAETSIIDRETILLNLLKDLKNIKEYNIPLSVYYLFYDGFNPADIKPIKLDY